MTERAAARVPLRPLRAGDGARGGGALAGEPGNRLLLSVFTSMWEEASPRATCAAAAEALRGGDPRAVGAER